MLLKETFTIYGKRDEEKKIIQKSIIFYQIEIFLFLFIQYPILNSCLKIKEKDEKKYFNTQKFTNMKKMK